jgi:serine protease inhibitor
MLIRSVLSTFRKFLGIAGWIAFSCGFQHVSQAEQPTKPTQLSSSVIASANNRFAINLLKNIQAEDSKNQFFSPFSIEAALLMAMEGARHETAMEMGTVLGFAESLRNSSKENPWQLSAVHEDTSRWMKLLERAETADQINSKRDVDLLREKLASLNKSASQKTRNGDYAEASKLSVQANQLAEKINLASKAFDRHQMSIANAVWAEQTLDVLPSFQNTIARFYGTGGIQSVDFIQNAESQRNRINLWVSQKTQDKIRDLIAEGALVSQTRMVLANAIYFRGNWAQPFPSQQTKQKPFFLDNTQSTTVPMMSNSEVVANYAAFDSDGNLFPSPKMIDPSKNDVALYPKQGFQAIDLRYNGDEISMTLFVPIEKQGLASLIQSMDEEKLSRSISQMEMRECRVELPRFKLETTYDLGEILQSLGMKRALSPVPGVADFSGISTSQQLFISKVIHKAFVDVNEKGTEAAAATAVMMNPTAMRMQVAFIPQIIADRPFLFLIRHRESGLILFAGIVKNPE